MHLSLLRRLARLTSVTLVLALVLGTVAPMTAHASSWSPTLLVNTEAFQTIDAGDGTTNMELQFGTSTKTLKFLYGEQRFQFSHSLNVIGNISGTTLNINGRATVNTLSATGAIKTKANLSGSSLTVDKSANFGGAITATGSITTKGTLSGQTLKIMGTADVYGALTVTGAVKAKGDLTINEDGGATDAVFTFGNATANQTLKFLNTRQKFQFSKSLSIIGNMSGSSLTVDRNATVGGTLTASGAITTKGALSGSTLTVDGNITLHGVTYSAPTSQGGSNTFLKNDGAGNLTWSNAAVGNGSGGIISLHPEYTNAIYFSSGANLVGQLSASGSAALNENFYHWTTTRATLQDYWISVRVRVPDNFSTWDPVKPVEIRYKTADGVAANNYIKVLMKDTTNTYIPTLTGSMLSPAFKTSNLRGPESSGTWTPKGYFTIYIKMAALTGKFAEVGYINLNFETTTP